jgi:hypothetical protein
MRRSFGIISGAFALRSRALALVGHLVFSFFGCQFALRRLFVRVAPGQIWRPIRSTSERTSHGLRGIGRPAR